MESSLLEQEEAFRKLNTELELRTRKLMKEVEEAISKKDVPSLYDYKDEAQSRENVSNLRLSLSDTNLSSDSDYDPLVTKIKNGCLLEDGGRRKGASAKARSAKKVSSTRGSLKTLTGKLGDEGDGLPLAARGLGTEGLIRFLKAKLKIVEQELTISHHNYTKKSEEHKRSQGTLKVLEEERGKLQTELASVRDKLKKKETGLLALQDRLQLRDQENSILKKEIEVLRTDLKKLSQSTSGNDLKLNSCREEVEKLRTELKRVQLSEKEIQLASKRKSDEMTNALKKLEKQKSQLATAFKKQLLLIDNLKRQKAMLEANHALNFTEEEFLKMLDWNPQDSAQYKS